MMTKRLALLLSLFGCFVASAQTTLPTAWNFSSPGISTPPNGWTLGLGTNGNLTYTGSGFSVGGDGIAARLDATAENIVIWFADKPGPLSYYLRGSGISPNPAFTGTFKVQESVDGNTWNDLRAFTTMTATMTRYVDNPSAASRYVRFYYTDKQAGSNVALDSVWLQQAPPPTTASLVFKKGNTQLVNNTTFVVGNDSIHTFTVENKGTQQTLYIWSHFLWGSEAADYWITGMPDSLLPNSSAQFTLHFQAGASGSRKASFMLVNTDPDKDTFELNFYGIGGAYASEPSSSPGNPTYSNVKAYGFGVHFNPSGAENYIVLRKKGAAITEVPADGQSYDKGDYIGAAQVAYIGTDTFFKPTYIFANTTYYFKVFAFNGPAGYENYLTSTAGSSNVTTGGLAPGNYYNGLNPKSSTFLSDLSARINPHDTIFYSNYAPVFVNNFLTRDTVDGKKVVSCVYTNLHYVYTEPFAWWNGTNGSTLTREHTYPQSWMPSQALYPNWPRNSNNQEMPEYNDLHHLFPADQLYGNGVRSNYPFAELVQVTSTSPSGQGKLGKDKNNVTSYEPRNEHKGDAARALFYMATAYNGVSALNWKLPANQSDSVLLKWHMQDPPDAWEIARMEFIASVQHNRNPFIDSPQYAFRINFKNMTWIPDSVPPPTPLLQILEPTASTVWTDWGAKKIKWSSMHVDTLDIFLSRDSGRTFNPIARIAASRDSLTYVNDTLSNGYMRVKLVDIKSNLTVLSPVFQANTPVGVDDAFLASPFAVYPNPSNGSFRVFAPQAEIIRVFDVSGKLVLNVTARETNEIRLENSGFYTVQVSRNGHSISKKVIVR